VKTKLIFLLVFIIIAAFIGGYYYFVVPAKTSKIPSELAKATLGVEASLLPAAVWVAENKGYFEEEGLALTIKPFDSGRASFLAMLNGEVDISTVAPTPIMFKSFARDDFSIFSTFVYSYEDVKVIARKDKGITEAADLVGKRVGTPAGTTGQFFVEAFMIRNGLLPGGVEVVDISPSGLPEALKNDQVDAIVIWEPHAYNAQKLLGDMAVQLPSSDVYKETFNFMVMKKFAQAHPEALVRFMKAIDQATDFIKNHKKEAQAIVAARLNLDKVVMTSLWDDFIFDISLDQSLIITLEDEARWAIKNKLTDKTQVPNYLNYIYFDALEKVKPGAIGIIR